MPDKNEAEAAVPLKTQAALPGLSHAVSAERMGWVRGIRGQLDELMITQSHLVSTLAEVSARIDLNERNIESTRDYIYTLLNNDPDELVPPDMKELLRSCRFIGVRIGTACIQALSEVGTATT